MQKENEYIVFFDGYCSLCNRSVDFIIRHDPEHRIKFASLQSEFAQTFLPQHFRNDVRFDTIIFYSKGQFHVRSGAVLRILRLLDRFYLRWMIAFIVVPPFLRDFVYRILARNRYRWFGKKETCRIPTPKEAALFIEK